MRDQLFRGAGRYERLLSLLLALSVAVGAAACSRLKAKSAPEGPPLDVPAPPPRDVEATEVEPPQPIPLIAEPARNAPPRPRPTTPPPPREAPKPEPPKPEAPPEQPKPAEEAPRPAPTLQTMPAGEQGDLERGIRVTLSRAASDLSRVDYRTLNADARTQYDYAKAFIRQAEENIKAKHLEYAKTVAEKAAAIAAQLTSR
jgi:outer membrane biosynthesis protein TonB